MPEGDIKLLEGIFAHDLAYATEVSQDAMYAKILAQSPMRSLKSPAADIEYTDAVTNALGLPRGYALDESIFTAKVQGFNYLSSTLSQLFGFPTMMQLGVHEFEIKKQIERHNETPKLLEAVKFVYLTLVEKCVGADIVPCSTNLGITFYIINANPKFLNAVVIPDMRDKVKAVGAFFMYDYAEVVVAGVKQTHCEIVIGFRPVTGMAYASGTAEGMLDRAGY
jgi:hypothetical protein